MEGVLKWTVLSAATSQPRTCMTKAAMVFPTYLERIRIRLWHMYRKCSAGDYSKHVPNLPVDNLGDNGQPLCYPDMVGFVIPT